ncbi:unnamed protein product [Tilletia controversa]|uniref:Actin-related protein 8 n=3 Tax=Tilletia TaxID=13289 RepID=A0A8X7MPX2_9BASI|nr:hypothetical protein CF328_g5035 [Tilletia controversa]KAE8199945.1 hypothetical protein CF336_g954 [Tilletia laevis]KAE8263465.1 hypothetical protein A4X03_0g1654 [Tilletia caries]KAE8200035.1 hypothetical protein CF335_g4034 [Tilletia laevis]KAE8244164.1 hypothetical protein A4X06_0g5949 [Tilletia controversa]
MVLLKAAPRHAAGYALIELGAASVRVSLPDEVAQAVFEERPTKKLRTSKEGEDSNAVGEQTASVNAVLPDGQQKEGAAPNAGVAVSGPTGPPAGTEVSPDSDDELPSAHSSSRTGARVTSSTAATAPADPSEPLHRMPNLIARARTNDAATGKRIYVADQLLNDCSDYSSLHLRSPLERGFITDWAAQKVILDRAISVGLAGRPLAPRQPMAYTHAMAARTAKSTGVTAADVSFFEFGTDLDSRLLEERTTIFTEPYFNFPDSSAATDTILFEQYGVAAVWRVTPAQLVPFAPIFQKSHTAPPQEDISTLNTTGLSAPDCLLVVDLGHSSTNIVPLICAQARWDAARRLDIGGKLLTNLLKETLSFRQWDMMDETWLVQAIKERCCFLAPGPGVAVSQKTGTMDDSCDSPSSLLTGPRTSGIIPSASDPNIVRRRRNEVLRLIRTIPPSQWGLTLLVELCKLFPASNPITQDYVLPDYSEPSAHQSRKIGKESVTHSARTLGYVRRGAGSEFAKTAASRRRTRRREQAADDDMVADLSLPCERKAPKKKSHQGLFLLASQGDDSDSDNDGEDDDEDDDDEDFDPDKGGRKPGDGGSDSGDEGATGEGENDDDEEGAGSSEEDEEEDDDAQVLKMSSERFSIPEVLFAPGRIGLAEAPLHEAIADSIRACPEDVRDMMWSNIVLVGGGARLPGLRRRLQNELRSLAPEDMMIHIWEYAEPENAAAHGALALLRAPPDSAEARFFRAHTVTRTEWASAGAAVCRARFGGWMAMHDGSMHIRRDDDEDEEEEVGVEMNEVRARGGGVYQESSTVGPRSAMGKGKGKEKARPVGTGPSSGRSTTASAQMGDAPLRQKPKGRPKGSKNKKKEPIPAP